MVWRLHCIRDSFFIGLFNNMEKFYYESDEFIKLEFNKCEYTGEIINSRECVKCTNNRGYDIEEKYVKCLLYDNDINMNELLKTFQNRVTQMMDLKTENELLKARILSLEKNVKEGGL